MKVNFIGGFLPEDKIEEYAKNSRGVVHYAADSLQKSIITGLELDDSISTKLITAPFLINYPHYKKIFIKKEKTEKYEIAPFINLKLIDTFTKSFSLNKIIRNQIPNDANDNVIIIYGMFDYFLKAIPHNYKNKVCLIIPDLPRMMGGDMNKLKIRLYISYWEKIVNDNLYKVDCFVFISKYMKEYVDVKNKPWVVIEGIYNNKTNIPYQKKENNKTILYTGTLDRRYGILDLLDAFSLIEGHDYRLWICGEGIGKTEVEAFAQKDSRITYFGQISNKEAQVLQKKATILVNPRKNDMEYTKFSFPSKTMEYLASGTPTIMHKLGGIPEEYYPYFFVPVDNSPSALANVILRVANLSELERKEFGEKAQNFVFENKNPKIQVEKIISMFNKLL
ncbi:glycosyltransferase [Soonwooa purpurea]